MREEEKNHLYAKLLSIISDEDRLKYEGILADLLTAHRKTITPLTELDTETPIMCINCSQHSDELDDDGFCPVCVIEIGISRQEANNDRD